MDIRIELASRFLSALICRDPKRSIESRLSEVRHALLLAEVLIAAADNGEHGSAEIEEPPTLRQAIDDARVLDEPGVPYDHLERHAPKTPPQASSGDSGSPPTLH